MTQALVNKSLVKQPRYGRSTLNHPSKQSRHGIGNPQQPAILAIARDRIRPTGRPAESGSEIAHKSKKFAMLVFRSSAALRTAKTFGSSTSAMVGATIVVVGKTSASSPDSRASIAATRRWRWRRVSARSASLVAQPRSMRIRTFGSDRHKLLASHDRVRFGAIGDAARDRSYGIERLAQRKSALGRNALTAWLETDQAT